MKVLFLTPSLSRAFGGVYEIERNLALALQKFQRVSVEAVGLEDEFTAEDLSEWAPIQPTVVKSLHNGRFGFSPALTRTVCESDADILHQHGLWTYSSIVARGWGRATGRPRVVSVHGMLDDWALGVSRWKKKLALHLYELSNLASADCLQVNSDAEYQQVRSFQRSHNLSSPICVIPNGVPSPSSTQGAAERWDHLVPPSARVLLFLGRIHPKKGIRELLTSFARIDRVKMREDWRLAIVGWDDGGHQESLMEYAEELELEGRVHWLGPAFGADKVAAFERANAFILPSFSEGLPIAVLEAWSHGLPVLMTRECHLPIGFSFGAAQLIHSDPDELSQELLTFFRLAGEELTAMGARGRLLVAEHFTWNRVADEMLAVYRWLLGDADRPDSIRPSL